MLTHVEIEGFRSLRHVDLDLPGLTVLIGANNSGKSNLLDVFALMSESATGQLNEGMNRRGGFFKLFFRDIEIPPYAFSFNFKFTFASGEFGVEDALTYYKLLVRMPGIVGLEQISRDPIPPETMPLELMHYKHGSKSMFRNSSNGKEEEKKVDLLELPIFQVKDYTAYPVPFRMLSQFEAWIFYRPIRVDPDAPIRRPQLVRSGIRLSPDGSNLASVLHAIQSQHLAIWEEIIEILKNTCEGFRRISLAPEGGDGKILLRWWDHTFQRNDEGFSIDFLSDGTLRFLCLLAILKTPNPPPLICIEEPEIGLHPDWIKVVAELLESAATRTQIIVATHSPQLISHVKPEHVVVVEKENGETSLSRLTEEELEGWLDKFRLGDLWLAGHIGGRP